MKLMRYLKRQPVGFWLVAALLGLAVGATATIAVIVDALVLNPIPVPHPDRLVELGGLARGAGLDDPAEFWAQAKGLDSIGLYRAGDIPLREGVLQGWTRVAEISGGFFRVFRVDPVIGRTFSHRDEIEGTDVAVVSDSFWRRRLLGRGDVVGNQVRLGDRVYTVVGVAPRGFDFPPGTQVWIPRAPHENNRPPLVEGASDLAVVRRPAGWVGRVRDDSSRQQVQSQLEALLAYANQTLSPKTGIRYGEIIGVAPLEASLSAAFRPTLWTLMAGATIVLVVSTTNCALFALGLFTRRRTDLAIRQVLGASPGRVVRHLLGPAVMIGAVSSVVGLVMSVVLLRIAEQSLHAFGVTLDTRPAVPLAALGLSLVLGLLSGFAGGLLPAIRARGQGVAASLNRLAPVGPGRRDRDVRRGFTIVQIGAAVVLSVGAILTVRTLTNLNSLDLGQDWNAVTVMQVSMPRQRLMGAQLSAVQTGMIDEVRSVPGVIDAAAVDRVTIGSGDRGFQEIRVEDRATMASVLQIAGDYFRTMEIRLVKGRAPASRDSSEGVVNETLAHALWPTGVNPVGQSLHIGGQLPLLVTGVVVDTRTVDQGAARIPELYVAWQGRAPQGRGPAVRSALVVRCATSCPEVLARLHQRLTAGGVTVYTAGLGANFLSRVKAPSRVRAFLWATYAILTIGVALIGVATLVGFSVASRRFEIGTRLAVGATRHQMVWLVAKEGALCSVAGLVAGATASRWLGAVFTGLVFGGHASDWMTIAEACAAVLACSTIASLIPALRISGNEPLDLLRRT